MARCSGRIALVTGGNKGIGFEVARRLAEEGASIVIGARDPERGEAAATSLKSIGCVARWVRIDLTDLVTISAAASDIEANEGHIDILVNNAGILSAGDGAPGRADIEAVRRTFETNFFGTLAVTQAMLPLVKRSSSGRVVNVSSLFGSMTEIGNPNPERSRFRYIGYGGSKAAVNMLTVQLAGELRDLGIKVNSADPGYTATDLNRNRGHQTVAEGASIIVELALLPNDGPTGGFFDAEEALAW